MIRKALQVRYFFWHGLGLKLLSLAIAAGLWIFVFGSQTVEMTKEIPFEVMITPDQVLTDSVPEKITFRLSGPKAFLRSISSRLDEPIRANAKGTKTGVITHRIYNDSIKLPMGVRILSITPNIVQIRVEELRVKQVPVKLDTYGTLAPGLKLSKLEVIPHFVRIKGPKSRVGSIQSVSPQAIDLSTIEQTQVIPLVFDFLSMGLEPDSPLPEAGVEIQSSSKIPLYRIKHVPLKVRSDRPVIVEDREVTLFVRGAQGAPTPQDLEKILAFVEARDLAPGENLKWVRVTLPDQFDLVRVQPAYIRVVPKGKE